VAKRCRHERRGSGLIRRGHPAAVSREGRSVDVAPLRSDVFRGREYGRGPNPRAAAFRLDAVRWRMAVGASRSLRAVDSRRQEALMPPTIDEIVERARRRLARVTPEQAAAELAQGALVVDIRTESGRAVEGEIPGVVAIDRTVLEWRLDPTSPSRLEQAKDHQVRVIVVCAEGYSSSLAAASLQDIGLLNATDVIGGFEAWKAASLPIKP